MTDQEMKLKAATLKGERISREETMRRIFDWIDARTPAAVVRFLEGEARVLYAEPGKEERIKEASNKLYRQTGIQFSPDQVFAVRACLLRALDSCDVAAIAGSPNFPAEHTMWVERVEKIFAERASLRTRPVLVTEGMVNRELRKALPDLVKAAPLVSAISCRNVRPFLESYGSPDIRVFQIPSQYVKRAIDDEYEAALHNVPIWPNFIKDLESQITVRTPGEVFLIGAGLFGKHLCVRIRDLGGIALDVGSAMDSLVGKPTRGRRWQAFTDRIKHGRILQGSQRTTPSLLEKIRSVTQKADKVARKKIATGAQSKSASIVRRPIGAWAREIQETGIVLSADTPGKFTQYAIFEGDIVAQLLPAADGWSLREIEPRDKVIIAGRYGARNLTFAPDPLQQLAKRSADEPRQTIDISRIKLAYNGTERAALLKMRGQTRDGDWDLEVTPLDLASLTNLEADTGEFKVGISREGRYIAISGLSSLVKAKANGKSTIDATVVVRHSTWEQFREACVAFAAKHRGLLYQRVSHPDLTDLPAGHDDDRLPILKRALQGVNPAGKRVLDIGAHWGQISRMMEDLGFEVTAVEHSPRGARIAKALRDATEAKYRVWKGSIFDFPDIEQQDVILGLNIFHHFLKRKETFDGLVSILNRSKAELIIFSAHVYGRGSDFVGAYKDFPPDAFAAFVAKESNLNKIEHVGTTHDGRRMYKLSRS